MQSSTTSVDYVALFSYVLSPFFLLSSSAISSVPRPETSDTIESQKKAMAKTDYIIQKELDNLFENCPDQNMSPPETPLFQRIRALNTDPVHSQSPSGMDPLPPPSTPGNDLFSYWKDRSTCGEYRLFSNFSGRDHGGSCEDWNGVNSANEGKELDGLDHCRWEQQVISVLDEPEGEPNGC